MKPRQMREPKVQRLAVLRAVMLKEPSEVGDKSSLHRSMEELCYFMAMEWEGQIMCELWLFEDVTVEISTDFNK